MAIGPSDLLVLGAEGKESIKVGQEDASLKDQRNSDLGINSEPFFFLTSLLKYNCFTMLC